MKSLNQKQFTLAIEHLVARAAKDSKWGTWEKSPRTLSKLFIDSEKKYPHVAVSKEFLAAQAYAESMFSPDAVSHADAQGISQFIPTTWEEWGKDLNNDKKASPFNPAEAVDAQARYMIHIYDEIIQPSWGGELGRDDLLMLSAAGYNAGPSNAKKLGLRLLHPVFGWQEPRAYIRRIKRLMSDIEKFSEK